MPKNLQAVWSRQLHHVIEGARLGYQVRKCNCARKKKLMKVQYSPLDGTNGGVDLDLAGCILEQEHTAHHAVEVDSGQLSVSGDPVCTASVLVDSQAVGEDFRHACQYKDTKLLIRVMLFAIEYSISRGKGRNEQLTAMDFDGNCGKGSTR